MEETVETIATLHAKYENETSRSQRFANRVVDYMGSGAAIGWLTGFIVVWVVFSVAGDRFGISFDRPPFNGLQTILSATALFVTLVILRTQRHEDEAAQRRERLTLQLAIVSDRKSAKIVALLEELRRDSPFLASRHDSEAHDMSVPSDPHAVLNALRKTDGRGGEPVS